MGTKKGNLLPKTGKILHQSGERGSSRQDYGGAIADALRQDLGATHQAIKSVMRWTGASERTVKYWFAGKSGPSGEHLIALARHSDKVLAVFLRLTGRQHFEGALRLIQARDVLSAILESLQKIMNDGAEL
jgi:hypothetical protein